MGNLHIRHAVSLVLFIFGTILDFWGSRQTLPVCMWIGFGLIFVAFVINLTVRCPNCGYHLAYRRFDLPNFCPECGQAIDENEE